MRSITTDHGCEVKTTRHVRISKIIRGGDMSYTARGRGSGITKTDLGYAFREHDLALLGVKMTVRSSRLWRRLLG